MAETIAELAKKLIESGAVNGDMPIQDCTWMPTKIRNVMAREWATRRYPESDILAPFRRLLSVTDAEILDFMWIGGTELQKLKDAMLTLLGEDPNKILKEATEYSMMPEKAIEEWVHYHLDDGTVLSEQTCTSFGLPEGLYDISFFRMQEALEGWLTKFPQWLPVTPDEGNPRVVNRDKITNISFETRVRDLRDEHEVSAARHNTEVDELRAMAERVIKEEGGLPDAPKCPEGCGCTLDAHLGPKKHLYCRICERHWSVPEEMSMDVWQSAYFNGFAPDDGGETPCEE